MQHDRDLIQSEAERGRHPRVVDLGDILQLGEVVPGPERPELRPPPLEGPCGQQIGVGARETAPLLHPLEFRLGTVSTRHRPRSPALEYGPQITRRELQIPSARPHPRGDVVIHPIGNPGQMVGDVGAAQT